MPHFGYIAVIVVQQVALFGLLWVIARLLMRGPGGVKRATGKARIVALQPSPEEREQRRQAPVGESSEARELVGRGV